MSIRRGPAGAQGGSGRLASDFHTKLSAPRGDSRLPRVLRPDEVAGLLDEPPPVVDLDPPAVRLRDDAVLELLYGCGLRVGELCGLDVDSVHAEADRLEHVISEELEERIDRVVNSIQRRLEASEEASASSLDPDGDAV